jgi:multidrug transporter EmrE-like cation transporter
MPPALLLAIGIMAEIAATLSLKLADGVSKPHFLIVTGVGYAISFSMLSLVLREWSVGPVYAIWAGCGVAGVALAGVLLFNDSLGLREFIGFCAIIIGVVMLSLNR